MQGCASLHRQSLTQAVTCALLQVFSKQLLN